MAKVTKSVTLRPKTPKFGPGTLDVGTDFQKCIDNNLNTNWSANTGKYTSLKYTYFQLDNFSIPSNAVIKSVTFRIYGNRTDSSSYCDYNFNLIAADNLDDTSTGKSEIFGSHLSPELVPYYSSGGSGTGPDTRSITQNLTEQQSATYLACAYPSIRIATKGSILYIEFYVDFTYEVEESKLYIGSSLASAVYVGSTKASAVYIGDTQIL